MIRYSSKRNGDYCRGFSVADMLMTVAIVSIVMSIMIPAGTTMLNSVKAKSVMEELEWIAEDILDYQQNYNDYPGSIVEVYGEDKIDHWGNPYQYLKIMNGHPSASGKARKYKSLKQINNFFDLYSMGPDGESTAPLTASISKDDVIYADDGGFIGYVDDYK